MGQSAAHSINIFYCNITYTCVQWGRATSSPNIKRIQIWIKKSCVWIPAVLIYFYFVFFFTKICCKTRSEFLKAINSEVLLYLRLVTKKPSFFGVFDQVRHKPACSASETSYRLEIFSSKEQRCWSDCTDRFSHDVAHFAHALGRCLAKFSTWYRSCLINISLCSDINILTNRKCFILENISWSLFKTMVLLWVWLYERYRSCHIDIWSSSRENLSSEFATGKTQTGLLSYRGKLKS